MNPDSCCCLQEDLAQGGYTCVTYTFVGVQGYVCTEVGRCPSQLEEPYPR